MKNVTPFYAVTMHFKFIFSYMVLQLNNVT